ncbi:MAG: cytidine deaminase [Actinomycetaceae bacterium]|nr:cytidine deaminase [Actinomycetaceae bacterium]
MSTIDWEELRSAAIAAKKNAYAPYSGYPVGAAALVDDGRIVSGCNVENASYGLGTCAENGVVADLYRTGGGRLRAIYCVNGSGEPVVPCGRCRQILYEHGGAGLLVAIPEQIMTLGQLLPHAFGPAHLREVPSATARNLPTTD